MIDEPMTMDLSEFAEAQLGYYCDLAMVLHLGGVIDARKLADRLEDRDNPIGRCTPMANAMAQWGARKLRLCVTYAEAKQALYGGDGDKVDKPTLRVVRPENDPS